MDNGQYKQILNNTNNGIFSMCKFIDDIVNLLYDNYKNNTQFIKKCECEEIQILKKQIKYVLDPENGPKQDVFNIYKNYNQVQLQSWII